MMNLANQLGTVNVFCLHWCSRDGQLVVADEGAEVPLAEALVVKD